MFIESIPVTFEEVASVMMDHGDAQACIAKFAESIGAHAGWSSGGACVLVADAPMEDGKRVLLATATISQMHCYVHGVMMGITNADEFLQVVALTALEELIG